MDSPYWKGPLPGVDVQRRLPVETFLAQAEQHSGVSQKVFGFSPESVFALRPECCSESARNPVRLAREYAPGFVGSHTVRVPNSHAHYLDSSADRHRCPYPPHSAGFCAPGGLSSWKGDGAGVQAQPPGLRPNPTLSGTNSLVSPVDSLRLLTAPY